LPRLPIDEVDHADNIEDVAKLDYFIRVDEFSDIPDKKIDFFLWLLPTVNC
jgi:hypothetical protein